MSSAANVTDTGRIDEGQVVGSRWSDPTTWRRGAGKVARPLAPIAAWIGIWWALAAWWLDNSRIFPTPPLVWDELVQILSGHSAQGSSYAHMEATAFRVVVAFAIAYTVGTVVGVVAGRVRGVYEFMSNLIWVGFAIPSVVWAFIFLVILGITNIVPIAALVVLLTAPVLSGTAEGIRALDEELAMMAKAYKASRARKFRDLYLPSVAPFMLANARIALALDLKIVIIAEVVGLPHGVGLLVRYWSQSVYMAPEVAWAIIFVVVGLIVDRGILGYFERRAKRWVSR